MSANEVVVCYCWITEREKQGLVDLLLKARGPLQ